MNRDEELKKVLEIRDALFNNMTVENATKYWKDQGLEIDWARPDVPLAAAHKARLQWLDVTDEMIEESVKWLEANGYNKTYSEMPPLTPETRDAQRIALGKTPLRKI